MKPAIIATVVVFCGLAAGVALFAFAWILWTLVSEYLGVAAFIAPVIVIAWLAVFFKGRDRERSRGDL